MKLKHKGTTGHHLSPSRQKLFTHDTLKVRDGKTVNEETLVDFVLLRQKHQDKLSKIELINEHYIQKSGSETSFYKIKQFIITSNNLEMFE